MSTNQFGLLEEKILPLIPDEGIAILALVKRAGMYCMLGYTVDDFKSAFVELEAEGRITIDENKFVRLVNSKAAKALSKKNELIKRLRKELLQTTDAFEAYRNYTVENADERIKSARATIKEVRAYK